MDIELKRLEIFRIFCNKIVAKSGLDVSLEAFSANHYKTLLKRINDELKRLNSSNDFDLPKPNTVKGYFYMLSPNNELSGKLSYRASNLDLLSEYIGFNSYEHFCKEFRAEIGCPEVTPRDLIYRPGGAKRRSSVPQELNPSVNSADIDTESLDAYLKWLIIQNNRIKLPTIDSSLSIPLTEIYIALQVERRITSYERDSALKNFQRAVEEKISRLGHKPDPEEERDIQAQVLREYPAMRSLLNALEKDSVTSLDPSPVARPQKGKNITVAEAFVKNRYLVILGAPGSGKSTLSKWLAIQLARAFQASIKDNKADRVLIPAHHVSIEKDHTGTGMMDMGPVRLPILIRIADYAKACLPKAIPLIDFIASMSASQSLNSDKLKHAFVEHLRAGNAVVILDGLDEISGALRQTILDNIQL